VLLICLSGGSQQRNTARHRDWWESLVEGGTAFLLPVCLVWQRDRDGTVLDGASSSSGDDDDGSDDDGVSAGAMDVDNDRAPAAVPLPRRPAPVIDDDGFELVQKAGRRR
jgi:hypothetical protein